MTTFPGSPRVLKAGLVLLDPETGAVQRAITLQYNPETLSRTLKPQTAGEGANRGEAARLAGPPVETIKLDASIDAADQLELPERNPEAVASGIQPQLAVLETLLYPESGQLQRNQGLASAGTLEIVPSPGPLLIFVWGKERVVPVVVTDFSIQEESFDPDLNPILAKVSLGLRVLSVSDLPYASKGGSLYMAYQQTKERLARSGAGKDLGALGIGGSL